jgi:fluoride exporter
VRTIWIGMAGFAGAISRYEVEGWVARWTTGAFPWGTFVVNLSGCLLLGFMIALFTERLLPHPELRAALTIGFVGAYTTFSTFAYETLRLGQESATGLALINVLVSVAAGIAAAWLGTVLGRLV